MNTSASSLGDSLDVTNKKSQSPWGTQTPESTAKLLDIQSRALKEYQFLSSLFESALITDYSQPDNPM